MPKRRVNVRVREELWAAVERTAKARGENSTAVLEDALEQMLGVSHVAVNGPADVSPKLRPGGVKPVPKGKRR